jgi:hypothetical protein
MACPVAMTRVPTTAREVMGDGLTLKRGGRRPALAQLVPRDHHAEIPTNGIICAAFLRSGLTGGVREASQKNPGLTHARGAADRGSSTALHESGLHLSELFVRDRTGLVQSGQLCKLSDGVPPSRGGWSRGGVTRDDSRLDLIPDLLELWLVLLCEDDAVLVLPGLVGLLAKAGLLLESPSER